MKGRALDRVEERARQRKVRSRENAVARFVALRVARAHALDRRLRRREAERDAFTSQRIEISRRVANEQDVALHAALDAMLERSRATHRRRGRVAVQTRFELRKSREQRVVTSAGTMRGCSVDIAKEDRNTDEVVGHRRNVGLGVGGEMHFDVRAPRAHRVMPAKPEARTMTRPALDTERTPDRRAKPVRGDEPARAKAVRQHDLVVALHEGANPALAKLHTRFRGAVEQCVRERRAPHAEARADRKMAECLTRGIPRERIPNTDERTPRRPHTEEAQRFDAARHDAFAARLVDHRSRVRVDDDDGEAGFRSVNRGAEPGRTAARDDDVVALAARSHRAGSIDSSAASSVRIRTVRSHAFNAVKTSAVIHAE